MRTVPVSEAKARFSELLTAVEAGEEIVITRRGKAVARLSSQRPLTAAVVLAPLWQEPFDIEAPDDQPPEPVTAWDD